MNHTKPKVPEGEISDNYYEYFMGDANAQDAALQTIVQGLQAGGGKIYIVHGPIRSGKGTIRKKLMEPNPGEDPLPDLDFMRAHKLQKIYCRAVVMSGLCKKTLHRVNCPKESHKQRRLLRHIRMPAC